MTNPDEGTSIVQQAYAEIEKIVSESCVKAELTGTDYARGYADCAVRVQTTFGKVLFDANAKRLEGGK